MFFDDSRPDRKKRAQSKLSTSEKLRKFENAVIPEAKSYELLSPDEVMSGERTCIFDVECYPNYFMVGFKCLVTSKIVYFELTPLGYIVNGWNCGFEVWVNYLVFVLHRWCLIGFNSRTYDLPMILVACQGVLAPKLFEVSSEIIREDMQAYEVEKKYKTKALNVNHIDIIEVAPITASLKIYSGRLHCERMQDLPYPFDTELNAAEAANVRDYNINDLDNTELLYNHLKPFIVMREQLGKEYKTDLRSKSDAQIAETIITSELEKIGVKIAKPKFELGSTFYYDVPDFIDFRTPQFRHALEVIRATPFVVGAGGSALCPQEIADLKPTLGLGTYRLGVGGLHSSEESVCYRADADTLLIDRDVASYYPYIILNNKLFPKHLGEGFLEVYRNIVNRRLKLKKEKNPLEAGLKIAINGTFGKLGNFYSKMYAPDLLTQVTMTGQLSLLMLIEMIEEISISVVSANTDGIVIRCPKYRLDDLNKVIMMWETKTSFVTEETRYEGLYCRDVNNYIACKTNSYVDEKTRELVWLDGIIKDVKTKGVFSEKGSAQNSVLSKNPETYICSEAVQLFLSQGVPIEQTIEQCTDVRKFVSVRTVKGGAEKNGVYLGKAIRWYYAFNETGTINYALSGNKVPKSEGAVPLMNLPKNLPNDLDKDWYVKEAIEILYQLGYYQRAKQASLF